MPQDPSLVAEARARQIYKKGYLDGVAARQASDEQLRRAIRNHRRRARYRTASLRMSGLFSTAVAVYLGYALANYDNRAIASAIAQRSAKLEERPGMQVRPRSQLPSLPASSGRQLSDQVRGRLPSLPVSSSVDKSQLARAAAFVEAVRNGTATGTATGVANSVALPDAVRARR